MQYGSRYPYNPAAQWFDMWQQMYLQWMTMFMPPRPGAVPASSEVEIELGSPNRVAKVSLRFGCLPAGGGKAKLSRDDGDEEFTVDIDDCGRFKLNVAAKQHVGTYSGEILDRCGSPCGWMKVSIGS